MELTKEQIANLIATFQQCRQQIKEKRDTHQNHRDEAYACGRDEEGDLHDDAVIECDTIIVNIHDCLKILK